MGAFRPLADGEPLGVVALSGPVDSRDLERGLRVLRTWGHPLVLAPNLRSRYGYLAGDDDERLAGLEWVTAHGARVVLAARGGFGATRLLDQLPWDHLAAAGVCMVGFSDMTALMNRLATMGGSAQVHGPMVAAGLQRARNETRLLALLVGRYQGRTLFRFGPREVLRPGHAEGIAVGGNLSMLTALIGTPHEPALDGGILFLEDVGEPLYRLDRMLTQLATSGRLDGVKALIGGTLRGSTRAPRGSPTWSQRLLEVAPDGAVVVTGLPFGHGARNMAFPLGVAVEVDADAGVISWSR